LVEGGNGRVAALLPDAAEAEPATPATN